MVLFHLAKTMPFPSRPSRKAAATPATKRPRRASGVAGQQADEHDDDLVVQMFAALNYDALNVELSDGKEELDPDGVAGRDRLTRAAWLAI